MNDHDRREVLAVIQDALDREGAERKKLWAQGQAQQLVLGMMIQDLAKLLPDQVEGRLRDARIELQRRRQDGETAERIEVQWLIVRTLEGALRPE